MVCTAEHGTPYLVLKGMMDGDFDDTCLPIDFPEGQQLYDFAQLKGGKWWTGAVGGVWSWWAANLRLPLLEKDLKRKYETFKEDVLLLRALFSE
jgi:hypothetical protein